MLENMIMIVSLPVWTKFIKFIKFIKKNFFFMIIQNDNCNFICKYSVIVTADTCKQT